MKYIERYKTRWHDTDAERTVRPTQLLVYMQETSNRHMLSCGMGLDELRDTKGLAFILSKIKLTLHKPLYASEEIEVETWTAGSRGFGFLRFYRILRGEEVIAECETTWALVGLEDKKLYRVDAFDFGFSDDPAIDVGLPQRFRVPKNEELTSLGERRIVYSDLDYNMHMNNTRYADMLCDFLPIEKIPSIRGISLVYLHEAHFGDTVDLLCAERDGEYLIRTVNQEGVACLEAQVLLEK